MHAIRTFLTAGLMVILMLGAAQPKPAGAADHTQDMGATPQALVNTFHTTLLGVMKDAQSLGFDGRRQMLGPAIRAAFHLPLMAQIVAGSHWRGASDAQKTALIDAFSDFTIATYANRFNGYSGERFKTLDEVPAQRGTRLVNTHLIKSDGTKVALNYLLRQFSGRWQIIDIYLDGAFSELATRRAEFTSVIGRKGFDALIQELARKTARLGKTSKSRG